ncbi:MAG: sulfatase-like hydrolase/transferase [Chitinophagaceae bacterium]|nr:sulfatase-like hydrolase/transferase [Chitinophagaceae bacterium]
MIKSLTGWLKKWPLFPWLLPVFFVLHGCTEHYDYVPFNDALKLTAVYLLATLVLTGIFWLWYRSFTKAGLAAFIIMAFHFFFGSMYDALQRLAGGTFLARYAFILPAAALTFVIAFIIIKKRKSRWTSTSLYLNSLLIFLILADLFLLTGKMIRGKKTEVSMPDGMVRCDNCPTPDIYFILADEYPGNTELKDLFAYDNSPFIDSLTNRGFHHVAESYSNYNYTPFSMASLLNMEYLQLEASNRSAADLTHAYEKIKNSKLLHFLQQHGYQLYNYSIFDFEGQPGRRLEKFLPVSTRLITSQTFLSRAENSIFFNLVTRFRSKAALKKLTYAYQHNNEKIYQLTLDVAGKKTSNPKFIYTHLEMPHYPYYFDKNGKERPFEKLVEGNQTDKEAFVSYLQYCNEKFLALIDQIRKQSATPPVIILMGDHGFRHFTQPQEKKYYFNNLAAVYLPGGNYSGFPDTLTGINFIRAIVNKQFNQQLPPVKDSMIYLRD